MYQHRIQHLPTQNDRDEFVGLSIPAVVHMEKMNSSTTLQQQLEQQTAELIKVKQQLRQTQEELEIRVQERTIELAIANEQLQQTLEEVHTFEEELRQQNEELFTAHETAQLERQRYQDLFNFAPDGYLVTDTYGIIQEANYAAAILLCLPQNRLVDKPLSLFIYEPYRQTFRSLLSESQQVRNAEVYLRPYKGKEFAASISAIAVQDPQGKLCGWRWLFSDITHRKQAEKQIKFQAQILSQVNDAVIAVDFQNRITYWNQGAQQLYNLKAEEILGQSLEQAYQSRWIKAEDEQAAFNALTATGFWRGENIHLKKNGEEIYVDSSFKHLRDDNGVTIGFLAIFRDITERKQAEEKLRYQAQILEQIHESVVSTDLNGYIISWNKGAERLFGYSASETLGQHISLFYPGEMSSVLEHQIIAPLLEKGEHELEVSVQNKSGAFVNVLLSLSLLCNQNQTPIGMVGYAIDITKRKKAEAALRQSEQQLQAIINNSTTVIYLKDIQGRYLSINRQYEFLCNITNEQIQGKTDYDIFPQEMADLFWANDQKVIAAETCLTFEEMVPLSDGVHTYIAVKFPLFNSAGKVYGICGISTDITKRKQAEQKINEQAALLNVATDAILVHNLENQILFWNQSAERLYGWQADEALGKNVNELLHQQTSPQLKQALKVIFECGSWQGEFNQQTKDSQKIIVQSRWTLIRDENGNPKSILTVNTDITEKKQLETQFLRAQRLESLGTLASGIAHDLNNLLTPILVVSQLLSRKLPNLDQQNLQLLKMQEDNAQRGAELVKQILSFARGMEGKRIPLQVKHLLKESERVIKSTFPKSIEICTHIPTQNLRTISADPTQIQQVLMNLAVNARDAMPNGGTLNISAENFFIDENYARMKLEAKQGWYVVITVSDTGCGISQQHLERIFEPFFTTKEPGQGTGLGLSTVIGIIKNLGGFVDVYSEVGFGSQFKIYLPASDQEVVQEICEYEIPKGNNQLILIVDDEAGIREITKSSLENYNYRVLTASDGIEGFSLYAHHLNEIQAVLMDVQMPSMDGLKAISILQKMNPLVKIIATSGLVSNRKLLETGDIGVKAFISKPYTIKELLNTLTNVLSAP